MNTSRRPAWWQLYLLVPAILGLLLLAARSTLPERGHEAAALAILVFGFALIELWLRSNSTALLQSRQVTLIRRPDPDGSDAPGAQTTAVLISWPASKEAQTPPAADGPQASRETRE